MVASGRYTGEGNYNISFHGVDRVLMSESGPEATVLDGEEIWHLRAFNFIDGESPNCIVEGFTITSYNPDGIGTVVCNYGSSPTLRNLSIRNCVAGGFSGTGGGLFCVDSSPHLIDVTFEQNWAESSGGGMVCRDGSPVLQNVVFKGNVTFGSGGGLSIAGDSHPTLSDLIFIDNHGGNGGGLAMNIDEPFTLHGALFLNNKAHLGAGARFSGGQVVIKGCAFYGNQANWGDKSGGGVLISGGSYSIIDCTFMYNQAEDHGSGIYIWYSANLTLERSIVALGSMAPSIEWDGTGPTPTLICNDVFSYVAENYGGALGDQTGINGNISANPLFCATEPLGWGTMSLHGNSPCLPENNDCGELMGGIGVGCTVTDIVSGEAQLSEIRTVATPNPFTATTEIMAALPDGSPASLRIYDLSGRLIRRLDTEAQRNGGEMRVIWDGRDERGNSQPSGVYLYKVEAGDYRATKRIIRLR